MFVTNISQSRVGIGGRIILNVGEVNRYISDEDPSVVAQALRLQAAGLVSVVQEAGLTKTVTTESVKLLGVDESGITKKPRTEKKIVEEVVEEVKPVEEKKTTRKSSKRNENTAE